MTRILALVFVLFAAPVSAQDRQAPPQAPMTAEHHAVLTHAAIAAHVVAQFADVSTTSFAMGRGGFREANPVMRPFAGNPIRLALVKGAYATGTSYLLLKLHRTRPKTAFGLAVLSVVTTGYVARRNARVASR